jgi:hypothetical protein
MNEICMIYEYKNSCLFVKFVANFSFLKANALPNGADLNF